MLGFAAISVIGSRVTSYPARPLTSYPILISVRMHVSGVTHVAQAIPPVREPIMKEKYVSISRQGRDRDRGRARHRCRSRASIGR